MNVLKPTIPCRCGRGGLVFDQWDHCLECQRGKAVALGRLAAVAWEDIRPGWRPLAGQGCWVKAEHRG